MYAWTLFALAAVEVEIDGVPIEFPGIRTMTCRRPRPKIELPTYRDAAGRSRVAMVLPEKLRGPTGDAVLDRLVELGLAVTLSELGL